ncbi:hypothetical protein C8R43DRAFT_289643 [Mycena crocata]|nr:hypothetical protein C8R43DRAFT_289643 [Mycena crocata]
MPPIPLSPPSPPTLSFGPAIGFAAVFGAVVTVSGLYVTFVRVRRGRAQRKARVVDAKQATDVTLPLEPEVLNIEDKKTAAASLLVRARVELYLKPEECAAQQPTVKGVRSALPRHLRQPQLPVSARFDARTTHTLPGPSPLCKSVSAPEVVLVAARDALATVDKKVPRAPAKLDLAKVLGGVASRANLAQLREYEVPARLTINRRQACSTGSPLRGCIYVADIALDVLKPTVVAPPPVLASSTPPGCGPTLVTCAHRDELSVGDTSDGDGNDKIIGLSDSCSASLDDIFSADIDASPPSPSPLPVIAMPRVLGGSQLTNIQRTPRVEKITKSFSTRLPGRRRTAKENDVFVCLH